ncbi:hypothetical protein ABPG75_002213 [Micractinium tetrahymenae]
MERLARRRGQPSVTNRNTPRSIRTRLAAPRRRTEPGEGSAVPLPDSPSQQVVRSASGKMALGPWMGAFGAMEAMAALEGEPTSPTLFATSQGAVFSDLEGSPVASREMGAEAEAAVAAAVGAVVPHPEPSRMARTAVRDELGVLRRKADATWRIRSAGPMGARPNAVRRRMRMIGQARKHN